MTVSDALSLAQRHLTAGSPHQAAAIYRDILIALPNHSAALFHLGGVCQDLGLCSEARECYRRLAALKPDQPLAHYQLALCLHQLGNLPEAVTAYRAAIRLRGDDAEAHNNLGAALKGLGQLDEAVACYEQALRLSPSYADAHNNLGVAMKGMGAVKKAVECYRRAIHVKPDFAQAHSNLGNALGELGRRAEAVECYQRALSLKPDYVDAHYNLGVALMGLGNDAQAESAFRQALRLRPAFPEAHNNLGNALQHQSQLPQAAAAYRAALQLRPDFADAAYNLGNVLRDLGDVNEAAQVYGLALAARPGYAEAHNNLANLLEEQGKPLEALEHARAALRLRPNWAPPLFTLAELAVHGHCQIAADEIQRMEGLLDDAATSPLDASQLYFAVALLRDKAGAHDEAFTSYAKGNALKRGVLQQAGHAFDPQAHRVEVDELIAHFDRAFFARVRGFGLETQVPIFIVGMPRSGTSLVEQILASHGQIFGAGELPDAGRLVASLPGLLGGSQTYPKCMSRLDQSSVKLLAEQYLQQLTRRGGSSLRITDKAIQNFLHLGLLAALFPRARIIHCRRDPRDVCVSCFLQYFRELNFTWDLEDLASYYRDYQRLMEHWDAVLPVKPMEVVYEELVAEPEAVSRKMIAFCGLEWDDRCLAFYENARPVQTMSKMQVRQPMYSKSIGRWKRYAAHLQPLLDGLQLDGPR